MSVRRKALVAARARYANRYGIVQCGSKPGIWVFEAYRYSPDTWHAIRRQVRRG